MNRYNLISRDYLEQNRILHRGKEGFGGSGHKHYDAVVEFIRELGAKNLLDYGAGECTLLVKFKKEGHKFPIVCYDPAVPKLASLPKAADLVVCTDVLEHVEPNLLDNVLDHIASLSRKGCYLAIATRPANKHLPNGKNAHAIIEDTPFWMQRLSRMEDKGLRIMRHVDIRKGGVPTGAPHEVRIWLQR